MDPTIERAQAFHGHLCPGLMIGVRAAQIALREIGPHSADEEVVAVVETDNCAVDAIQALTGCTFGKGNLIHRDYGKNVFSFYRRSDGKALRLVFQPGAGIGESDERRLLFDKVRTGTATEVEHKRFGELHHERAMAIWQAPEEQLFRVTPITGEPPRRARLHDSATCAQCGEPTMETRTRRWKGQTLCIPCFEQAERR